MPLLTSSGVNFKQGARCVIVLACSGQNNDVLHTGSNILRLISSVGIPNSLAATHVLKAQNHHVYGQLMNLALQRTCYPVRERQVIALVGSCGVRTHQVAAFRATDR